MIKLNVDGKQIEVGEGQSLLQACLDNGIFIPNLCFLKEMEDPPAACRLCFVEIEGEEKPVTSCKVTVREGMVVKTDSEKVKEMQRTVFQLLFSAHHMDCKNCLSRKTCQLQRIAKHLGVKLKAKKLTELGRDLSIQPIHPCFELLPARCILCQKCLYVCEKHHEKPLLKVFRKGFDTVIGYSGEGDASNLPCHECRACVEICPVSAILPKSDQQKELSATA
jgi:NADH dehydrogenase/NADH:ubiquinone oxidoreductase subunit G